MSTSLETFGSVSVQHAQRLYRHVYLTCREDSSGRSHYQALITLLAVLGVELANDEVLVDLIRLVLALQVPGAADKRGNNVLLMCSYPVVSVIG